ncbi:hypothetical protein MKW98_006103 [Papaver atlanticum]|uniref:Uncharacterized protein n=1 Tax=Papaver atlanticum TaxID=357466 RepID=A0AAD4TGM6_9MAGN|nr:hypothetical protein MKW98_006103 [Papaver atlanticum]
MFLNKHCRPIFRYGKLKRFQQMEPMRFLSWNAHCACSQDVAALRFFAPNSQTLIVEKGKIAIVTVAAAAAAHWVVISNALPPIFLSEMNSWQAGIDLSDVTQLPEGRWVDVSRAN